MCLRLVTPQRGPIQLTAVIMSRARSRGPQLLNAAEFHLFSLHPMRRATPSNPHQHIKFNLAPRTSSRPSRELPSLFIRRHRGATSPHSLSAVATVSVPLVVLTLTSKNLPRVSGWSCSSFCHCRSIVTDRPFPCLADISTPPGQLNPRSTNTILSLDTILTAASASHANFHSLCGPRTHLRIKRQRWVRGNSLDLISWWSLFLS